MYLASVLTPLSDENLQLAAQCGVTEIVHRYPGADLSLLQKSQDRIAQFGMRLSVVEGYLPIERLKLGLDDGTEILAMQRLIERMGAYDIPVLCYNFMSGTDWVRTRVDAPERGQARVTAFSLAEAEHAMQLGYHPADPVADRAARQLTTADLWRNLTQFLEQLLPVAERHGVTLCMHPDDPPLPELLGKPRIMHSLEGFERLLSIANSSANAVCFCVGSFAAMNVDIPEAIRRLAKRIGYVHFRDVRGTPTNFVETFPDNGPHNMVAIMRALREVGFAGAMRPDHVPQLVGEEQGEPGYTMLGRLFAYGYIRGLMQATEPTPLENREQD